MNNASLPSSLGSSRNPSGWPATPMSKTGVASWNHRCDGGSKRAVSLALEHDVRGGQHTAEHARAPVITATPGGENSVSAIGYPGGKWVDGTAPWNAEHLERREAVEGEIERQGEPATAAQVLRHAEVGPAVAEGADAVPARVLRQCRRDDREHTEGDEQPAVAGVFSPHTRAAPVQDGSGALPVAAGFASAPAPKA